LQKAKRELGQNYKCSMPLHRAFMTLGLRALIRMTTHVANTSCRLYSAQM